MCHPQIISYKILYSLKKKKKSYHILYYIIKVMSYIQWLHQVDAFSCCYYALKLLPKLKNKNKNQNQKYRTLI